jgi:hypothetical protein
MMLQAFEARYGDPETVIPSDIGSPSALRGAAGGQVFGGGLYRVLSDQMAATLTRDVFRAYPDYRDAVDCFATDWMGNVFAVRASTGQVVMFELATCETLGIGVPFEAFHTDVLVNQAGAALAEPTFQTWCRQGGAVPAANECVGYKTPLFFGGADEISNLELTDLEVYWHLTSQAIEQRDVRSKIIGAVQATQNARN